MEIVLEDRGDSIFRCTYVPVLEGPHTVYVTFAGQQIPRSPFTVHISEGELRFTRTQSSTPALLWTLTLRQESSELLVFLRHHLLYLHGISLSLGRATLD